jgi:hypothetical protein
MYFAGISGSMVLSDSVIIDSAVSRFETADNEDEMWVRLIDELYANGGEPNPGYPNVR